MAAVNTHVQVVVWAYFFLMLFGFAFISIFKYIV